MARQRLGQHFLVRASVLERIARAACGEFEPLVIEIGAGRGALTQRLLARAARVIAIELDSGLVEYLRRKFAGEPRVEIVCADALGIGLDQWGPAPVAGNLPYYAATPIIERVLSGFRRAAFLVQKEVAERLTARPGGREYGYLSVQTWLYADAEVLFEVKPGAFQPPPKVDSALVLFQPRHRAEEFSLPDPAAFLRFAGECFRQKRKTIRNNLAPVYGPSVGAWPEAGLRAEQIPPEQLAAMYRRVVA